MNSKKIHFILIGVIVLLFIGLIAGAKQINSLLVSRANNLTVLKAKSQGLDQQKIILAKAKQDVAKYTELEKITKVIVPEDKSQAEAVRELVNIAHDNDIALESITFPASDLGSTPAAKTGTGVAGPSPAANTKTKSLSQLVPVKNIPGVYQLEINVNSDLTKPVPFYKVIAFLAALEKNRRTAQVSALTLQPDPNNRNFLTFTLILNEYIKP